jgi:hypothetical protein
MSIEKKNCAKIKKKKTMERSYGNYYSNVPMKVFSGQPNYARAYFGLEARVSDLEHQMKQDQPPHCNRCPLPHQQACMSLQGDAKQQCLDAQKQCQEMKCYQ